MPAYVCATRYQGHTIALSCLVEPMLGHPDRWTAQALDIGLTSHGDSEGHALHLLGVALQGLTAPIEVLRLKSAPMEDWHRFRRIRAGSIGWSRSK